MAEHNASVPVPKRGPEFDIHPIDSDTEGDVQRKLYSPHPEDDRSSGTRDPQTGSSAGAAPARGEAEVAGHVGEVINLPDDERGQSRNMTRSGQPFEIGIIQRLRAKPLLTVALASAGGLLLGRLTRGRRR